MARQCPKCNQEGWETDVSPVGVVFDRCLGCGYVERNKRYKRTYAKHYDLKLYWTTKNEMEHIDTLVDGTYKRWSEGAVQDPVKLLKSYLRSCERRTEWGGMDKGEVVAYANEHLMRLEGEIA